MRKNKSFRKYLAVLLFMSLCSVSRVNNVGNVEH